MTEEHKRKLSEARKKWFRENPNARKKVSEFHKGRKRSKTTCEKISAVKKGKPLSQKHINSMSRCRIGKKATKETKDKMSRIHKEWWANHPEQKIKHRKEKQGKNNPNWNINRDFINRPYTEKFFNREFRKTILIEQNNKCICGKRLKKRAPLHHIDFNKQNDNRNNLIFLCRSCHGFRKNIKSDIEYIRKINNLIIRGAFLCRIA